MKKEWFYLMLLAAVLGLASCRDDADDVTPSDDDDEILEMTAEDRAEYAFQNFLFHVCQTESDSVTLKMKSWQLNYGRMLEPASPTVRYAKAASPEDARQQFRSMICYEAMVDSSSIAGILKVDMGTHGTVDYIPSNQNGEWARAQVSIQELPDLTEIVWLTPEAWPENDYDTYLADVLRGNVYRQWDTNIYYLCVQECTKTGTGYLIGFDTWTYDPNPPLAHGSCSHAWWAPCPGNEKPIEELRLFMYKGNSGLKDSVSMDIIQKMSRGQTGGDALSDYLYEGKGVLFKTGPDWCWVDTKDGGDWHWIRTPMTVMYPTWTGASKLAYDGSRSHERYINIEQFNGSHSWKNQKWKVCWVNWILGDSWIWDVNKWNRFQRPLIIEFKHDEARSVEEFLNNHHFQHMAF